VTVILFFRTKLADCFHGPTVEDVHDILGKWKNESTLLHVVNYSCNFLWKL